MSYYYNECCKEGYNPCNPCYDPCGPCNPCFDPCYQNYPQIVVKCKKKKKHHKSSSSSCSDSESYNAASTKSYDKDEDLKCIVRKATKKLKKKIDPIWDAVKCNYILKCSRSIAFGYCNTAAGCSNLAAGTKISACGYNSLYAGSNHNGNGQCMALLGTNINSNNYSNIFVFSDTNGMTGGQITLNDAAYFGVANGFHIYSNAARTVGVTLAAGGNSWAAVCDREVKKDMVEIDGGDVLNKLSTLKYYKFKYRDQADDDEQEFIAPTAQDFNSAFPLNKTNEKTISQFDATCLTMSGVAALNKRCLYLENELSELRKQLELRV